MLLVSKSIEFTDALYRISNDTNLPDEATWNENAKSSSV